MDVTERKTREEKIREQEAELRLILDLTPQLIAVYGPNRERLYGSVLRLPGTKESRRVSIVLPLLE